MYQKTWAPHQKVLNFVDFLCHKTIFTAAAPNNSKGFASWASGTVLSACKWHVPHVWRKSALRAPEVPRPADDSQTLASAPAGAAVFGTISLQPNTLASVVTGSVKASMTRSHDSSKLSN
jgi:hypothetical protein